ncbi:MAG: AEC family transporter, partial [Alkalispirochaeta sp.]
PGVGVLGIIVPVFLIAVLGYLMTWVGLFRTRDVEGLTRYVFSVALPVMLFDSMSKIELPGEFQWSLMAAYYLPTITLFGGTALIGRFVFHQSRQARAVFAMGASYSNTVLIGLPIISAAWGDDGLLPLLMIVTVHAAVLFLLTTALAETGASDTGERATVARVIGRTAAGIVRNPILIGIAAGVLANILSIRLPGPLDDTAGLIRGSALPAALFVTGASLREFRIAGHLPEAGVIIVLKMVVHPMLVWLLAAFVFQLQPLWIAVAVITAAMPTGINASVFARTYAGAVAPVATATLLSTILAVVSTSVLLMAFGV